MPEPVEVTRWGVRAVDTIVRVYINGALYDFDPHNAADLAQTIRVILGTDDAPSGAESPPLERRRELLADLTTEAIDGGSYGEPAPEMRPTRKCLPGCACDLPEEHTTCGECGSEPNGNYPVAHKPGCSRITIGPHLWPSPLAPESPEEADHG